MKRFTFLISVLVVPVLALCNRPDVRAQSLEPAATSKPELPPGPLIQKRAPEYSKWVVTTKAIPDKKEDAAKDDAAKNIAAKVTFTKTGNIIHIELQDEYKRVWNIWNHGSIRVCEWPEGKEVGFVAKPQNPGDSNFLYFDFSQTDFSGFDWISKDNFTGIIDVAGKKCLNFQNSGHDINGVPFSFTASIDAETHLPVLLVNGQGTSAYQFNILSPTMQTLPSNVQTLIDKQQDSVRAFSRKPTNPY